VVSVNTDVHIHIHEPVDDGDGDDNLDALGDGDVGLLDVHLLRGGARQQRHDRVVPQCLLHHLGQVGQLRDVIGRHLAPAEEVPLDLGSQLVLHVLVVRQQVHEIGGEVGGCVVARGEQRDEVVEHLRLGQVLGQHRVQAVLRVQVLPLGVLGPAPAQRRVEVLPYFLDHPVQDLHLRQEGPRGQPEEDQVAQRMGSLGQHFAQETLALGELSVLRATEELHEHAQRANLEEHAYVGRSPRVLGRTHHLIDRLVSDHIEGERPLGDAPTSKVPGKQVSVFPVLLAHRGDHAVAQYVSKDVRALSANRKGTAIGQDSSNDNRVQHDQTCL